MQRLDDAAVAVMIDQIRARLEAGGCAADPDLRAGLHGWKVALAMEFGARMGWKVAAGSTGFDAAELVKGRRVRWRDRTDLPPFHDHPTGYSVGLRPVALAIQPYGDDPTIAAALAAWAAPNGLVVWRPAFPSWWYPGWTSLWVFARRDAVPSDVLGLAEEFR